MKVKCYDCRMNRVCVAWLGPGLPGLEHKRSLSPKALKGLMRFMSTGDYCDELVIAVPKGREEPSDSA